VGTGRTVLPEGVKFVVERAVLGGAVQLRPDPGRPVWVVVIAGGVSGEGVTAGPGEVLFIDSAADVDIAEGSDLLLAYTGAEVAEGLVAVRA
jgi:mannose-6-phosphate isomerase